MNAADLPGTEYYIKLMFSILTKNYTDEIFDLENSIEDYCETDGILGPKVAGKYPTLPEYWNYMVTREPGFKSLIATAKKAREAQKEEVDGQKMKEAKQQKEVGGQQKLENRGDSEKVKEIATAMAQVDLLGEHMATFSQADIKDHKHYPRITFAEMLLDMVKKIELESDTEDVSPKK
ncbi:hypothetical protein JAAARDRAFT_340427 [Jaapia argillacea MUCL 33604]|uniref:Uncharacterized protein n=1 Tax=Jaapia argillacea MUCL 33604 TaxID=933084 RepID=A0A067PMM8_9AGAM|nr:hypothetical protein JAAARDRAFT_340427 [Jaapia argillacea MUCL 33604]